MPTDPGGDGVVPGSRCFRVCGACPLELVQVARAFFLGFLLPDMVFISFVFNNDFFLFMFVILCTDDMSILKTTLDWRGQAMSSEIM